MNFRRMSGYGVTALLSFAAGCLTDVMNTAPASVPAPIAAVEATPVSEASKRVDGAPLIVVSGDGNVTLRVEQQPLEWVLEQISKQSGWADAKQRASAASTQATGVAAGPVPAPCAEASMRTPAQAMQLLQMIERGSEAERFDGLLQARSDGVSVPDELLKSLFETDASERVRLLAFENYLEPRTGSIDEMRRALEAAQLLPNGAIQREAKRLLEELLESERIDAASLQADP